MAKKSALLTLEGRKWLIGKLKELTGEEYIICGDGFALKSNPDKSIPNHLEALAVWAGLSQREKRQRLASTPMGQKLAEKRRRQQEFPDGSNPLRSDRR